MKPPFLLIGAALLIAYGGFHGFSETVVVEAEQFTDSKELSKQRIQQIIVADCGGGRILVGLDYPQEWCTYRLCHTGKIGLHEVSIIARAEEGTKFQFRLTVIPDGSNQGQVVYFKFKGRGFGQ